SSANCPAVMNTPMSRIRPKLPRGKRTKTMAGMTTKVKRAAASSIGGQSRRPMSMKTKLTPQRTTTSRASMMGTGRMVPGSQLDDQNSIESHSKISLGLFDDRHCRPAHPRRTRLLRLGDRDGGLPRVHAGGGEPPAAEALAPTRIAGDRAHRPRD